MSLLRTLAIAAMLAFAPAAFDADAAKASADTALFGIWGVAQDPSGAPNCKGYVMVLRPAEEDREPEGRDTEGRYIKAILDLGTTIGLRDTLVGSASWARSGDRLVVEPTISLARPEPEQVFLIDRASDTLIREAPSRLIFRRCPDRALVPMER
jgi:hypothetical protein